MHRDLYEYRPKTLTGRYVSRNSQDRASKVYENEGIPGRFHTRLYLYPEDREMGSGWVGGRVFSGDHYTEQEALEIALMWEMFGVLPDRVY